MRIAKKPMSAKKAVRAAEEVVDETIDETVEELPPVEELVADVDPAATDLLFETEDVAQLLAEVTESEVTADVDEDTDAIVFTVNDQEYLVEPEGDEEILEATRKSLRGKKPVKASTTRKRFAGARRRVQKKN